MLKYRHILADEMCPLCNEGPETINHALLTCLKVRETWELAGLNNFLPREEEMSWLEFWVAWDGVDEQKLGEFCYSAYYVWQRRNKVVSKVGAGRRSCSFISFEFSERL